MSKCMTCSKDLKTGDKYAVETISIVEHKFYHSRCIKKDLAARARTVAIDTPWVDYPILKTGGRAPLYANREANL